MQITLCEDDGIFFDGVPRNVVIVVKFDDGKQVRLPYSADKTLSALYSDLNAIAPKVKQEGVFIPKDILSLADQFTAPKPKEVPRAEAVIERAPASAIDKSKIIEKEDIVTLIRLDEGRNKDATCLLVVGNEYRVIEVKSTGVTMPGRDDITRVVQGYDVVDDHADRQERTRVYPHEVELKEKRRSPIINLVRKVEEILPCPSCNAPNALALEGSDFKGICSECKQEISIARVIVKCKTEKCGKDVACYDVGVLYSGKCNTCLSNIEVPYA